MRSLPRFFLSDSFPVPCSIPKRNLLQISAASSHLFAGMFLPTLRSSAFLCLSALSLVFSGVSTSRSLAAGLSSPSSLHISLSSPLDFQVVQRSSRSSGILTIAGTIEPVSKSLSLPDKLEARLAGKSCSGDLPGQWQPLPCDTRVAAFRGELSVPAGGWYRLELRALRQGTNVASVAVEHVGIGEVFIIAGQSNSANYGEEKQKTETRLVAAFDGINWQLAFDPEPGATGKKGSFMPPFGDEISRHFQVPVGLVAMGIGSTSVREWLSAGTRLSRLPPLTHNVMTVGQGQWEPSGTIYEKFTSRMKQFGPKGFRAVLWHQGESDGRQADSERSLTGDLYRKYLEQLIRDSRQAIGWQAPWFVAQASYHNPSETSWPDTRDAQKAVVADGFALMGPDTDTLTGDMRERNGTGVHMSAKGLKAHGHLWFDKVSPWLDEQLKTISIP